MGLPKQLTDIGFDYGSALGLIALGLAEENGTTALKFIIVGFVLLAFKLASNYTDKKGAGV